MRRWDELLLSRPVLLEVEVVLAQPTATFIQGGTAQASRVTSGFLLVGSSSGSKCDNGRTLASEDPGLYLGFSGCVNDCGQGSWCGTSLQ